MCHGTPLFCYNPFQGVTFISALVWDEWGMRIAPSNDPFPLQGKKERKRQVPKTSINVSELKTMTLSNCCH